MKKKRFSLPLRILLWAIVLVLIIGVIHLAEMVLNRETIEVDAFDYQSKRISPTLDGFKIGFLTDIHIGNQADIDRLARAIASIEQQAPDLLLLGGDYSYGNTGNAKYAYEMLARLDIPCGIYAVLGNHDPGQADIDAMEQAGIHCLTNSGAQIAPGLFVAGVEDLWYGRPDAQRAIAGRQPDDFVLLLSHNPDAVRDLNVADVDLILSGHTHGGLANLFGIWSPAARFVTKYGNRFTKGLVHDTTDIFISNGLGDTTYPRVFARRQVHFITLRTEQ